MNESLNQHGTAVAIGGQGVLFIGKSGSGKSDLALRMIDQGALLVSDDRVVMNLQNGQVVMSAPDNIAGKIEVRHIGIVNVAHGPAPLMLVVDLDGAIERLPQQQKNRDYLGLSFPSIALRAFEASAPAKVKLALTRAMALSDKA